ncbi:MAG: M64 family metallopeptidase [Bacteroidales bacterium]
MNIKLSKIIFFLAALSLLLSCEKEPPAQLKLSIESVILSNIDAQQTISVSANGKWTATISSTWCTISPTSGDGNGEITITANDNPTVKERSVSLYVVSRELKKSAKILQSVSELTLDRAEFLISKDAATQVVNIISNAIWEVSIPDSVKWITATPLEGKGNGKVTFTIDENMGSKRDVYVEIRFANSYTSLRVAQQRGANQPPDSPLLKAPIDNLTDANRLPTFRWSGVKDPDGDKLSYKIEYSDNINSWQHSHSLDDTLFNLSAYLEANKQYYWRVSAIDLYDGATSYSEVSTFTTGTKTSYFDGEYKVAQYHTKGAMPSEILFVGDGYISEDFEEGGQFDADMDEGIEAFFSIEPYKSYREYFSIYKQAAYSRDRGVKQTDKNILKSTKFNSDFLGGSSLSTDTDEVFNYARKILGVDDEKLKELLIILVLNQDRYAGTCWMWSDGKAIAIAPVSRSTSPGSHFSNLINHEAGGHGFGRLADEYVTSENKGKTITEDDKKQIKTFVNAGFYGNVDLTGDVTEVKWKHIIGVPGYNRVRTYEGGFYFSYGVWRPETSSCMVQNEKYYNAPSREAMVKRIYKKAGMEYTLEAFMEKDIEKAPSQSVMMQTKSINPLTFVPLARPVMVE